MADIYEDFRALQDCEKEGRDYQIRKSSQWHPVLIIAPHGGNIERYTSKIAEWIAGEDFAWYTFEGIKAGDNQGLHITSHNFDEPTALDALATSEMVLTIHGHGNFMEEFVMVGGLDLLLCQELGRMLRLAGFTVMEGQDGYRGERRSNICNRGRTGKGAQLEISYALRKKIFDDVVYRLLFVGTIRSVLTRTALKQNKR
ncbi:MAG: poly-gamma-glutamate hydrolase family protein [Bacillota bacterium]